MFFKNLTNLQMYINIFLIYLLCMYSFYQNLNL